MYCLLPTDVCRLPTTARRCTFHCPPPLCIAHHSLLTTHYSLLFPYPCQLPERLVRTMVQTGFGLEQLESLPLGAALPLQVRLDARESRRGSGAWRARGRGVGFSSPPPHTHLSSLPPLLPSFLLFLLAAATHQTDATPHDSTRIWHHATLCHTPQRNATQRPVLSRPAPSRPDPTHSPTPPTRNPTSFRPPRPTPV